MGDIIKMTEHAKVTPKDFVEFYKGQQYRITYDPASHRWVWILEFRETYKFFGEADTEDKAKKLAHRKIHSLIESRADYEERTST